MKKWLAIATLLTSCSGTRPDGIGNPESIQKACPDTPNCVSSYHPNDEDHYMAPLKMVSEKDFDQLKEKIKKTENTKIIVETSNYVYAEFSSSLMGFVDDVEFLYDANDKEIHFRSASRLGKSDLGVNKKRVEKLISK